MRTNMILTTNSPLTIFDLETIIEHEFNVLYDVFIDVDIDDNDRYYGNIAFVSGEDDIELFYEESENNAIIKANDKRAEHILKSIANYTGGVLLPDDEKDDTIVIDKVNAVPSDDYILLKHKIYQQYGYNKLYDVLEFIETNKKLIEKL